MQRVALDATALPYHKAFLAYLRKEHEKGRPLILATASNYRTANAVADHLGLFSDTLSSTVETNMRHARKLEAIKERFPRFGYAGNDIADFPIWDEAEEVILVNSPPPPPAKPRFDCISAGVHSQADSRHDRSALQCYFTELRLGLPGISHTGLLALQVLEKPGPRGRRLDRRYLTELRRILLSCRREDHRRETRKLLPEIRLGSQTDGLRIALPKRICPGSAMVY